MLGLKVDITPVAELPAQKWTMGAWVGVADIRDHLLSLLLATLSPFLPPPLSLILLPSLPPPSLLPSFLLQCFLPEIGLSSCQRR